jgi:RHS repeat-associated protein
MRDKGLSQTQTPNYAKGKLTKVTSAVSETKYNSFDNFGRVLNHQQITDGNTYDSSYVYNLSGALIEEIYPSGRKVRNTLDVDGNLSQVQSSKANQTMKMYANSFNYNASGAVASMRLGNGKFENTQFNSRLQPIQIGLGSSATSQNLLKLNFDYGLADNSGNVKSQTITTPNAVFTQTYQYDSLSRLTEAKEVSNGNQIWKQNFGYDRFGNRTIFNQLIGQSTNNQTPSVDTANNRFNNGQFFVYDLNGNLIKDSQGRQFTFNSENKQTLVKDTNNHVIGQYFYDGDNLRIKKITDDEVVIFVYDTNSKLIAEYSTKNADNPKISYATMDRINSTRITTDESGQVIAKNDFMPFGEEIIRQNTQNTNLKQKFTGKIRDDETGLDDFLARCYSSNLGKFNSPDPVFISSEKIQNPQSWNLYVYVGNNPLAFTDPTGMERVKLGIHSDKEIKEKHDANNKKKKEIDADKTLSKDQKKEQKAKLDAENKTLGIEKVGNAVVKNMLSALESKGELNGLQLQDFTVSTDPTNDFAEIKGGPETGKQNAFVVHNKDGTLYSKEIFIDTQGALYRESTIGNYKEDWAKYGGAIVRHEQWHRDAPTSQERLSEPKAYKVERQVLDKFGPLAFINRELFNTRRSAVASNAEK